MVRTLATVKVNRGRKYTVPSILKMNRTCAGLDTIDLRNSSSLSSFIHHPYELILLNIIWPTISLMGLVGNMLFIWTVIKVPVLHTSTFVILSLLACTDSLSIIGRLIEHFSDFVTSPLRYGESSIPAATGGILLWVCFVMSLWLITLVSTERFLAICHPIKYRVLKETKGVFVVICVLTVVSVALGCTSITFFIYVAEYCIQWPPTTRFIVYPRKVTLVKSDYLTDFSEVHLFIFGITPILICLFVLFLINCYINIRTLKTLRTRRRNKQLQISTQFERNIHQVSIMVIANSVVYFVCISSFALMLASRLFDFVGTNNFTAYQSVVLENITITVMVINSSVNPLIYFITNQSYRKSFKKAILGGFCSSNHSKSRGVVTRADGMCASQL